MPILFWFKINECVPKTYYMIHCYTLNHIIRRILMINNITYPSINSQFFDIRLFPQYHLLKKESIRIYSIKKHKIAIGQYQKCPTNYIGYTILYFLRHGIVMFWYCSNVRWCHLLIWSHIVWGKVEYYNMNKTIKIINES